VVAAVAASRSAGSAETERRRLSLRLQRLLIAVLILLNPFRVRKRLVGPLPSSRLAGAEAGPASRDRPAHDAGLGGQVLSSLIFHCYLRKSLSAPAYRFRSLTKSFLRFLADPRRPMIFAPRGLMILESKVSRSVRYRVRAIT